MQKIIYIFITIYEALKNFPIFYLGYFNLQKITVFKICYFENILKFSRISWIYEIYFSSFSGAI